MAHRTLGFAATADAQLAELTAWLRIRWRRSGRLQDPSRGHRIPRELCRRDINSSTDPHDGYIGAQHGDGYIVRTDQGDWLCRAVVIASGTCNVADVPGCANKVPRSIMQLTAQEYRNPDQLPDGGVLVVGASSSGTQIAHEVHRSDHPVILSVGEHIRAPRVYRGKDLEWLMDAAGVLDERYDEVDNIARLRCNLPARPIDRHSTSTPSPQ